jgi:hypothetical protein
MHMLDAIGLMLFWILLQATAKNRPKQHSTHQKEYLSLFFTVAPMLLKHYNLQTIALCHLKANFIFFTCGILYIWNSCMCPPGVCCVVRKMG